MASVCMTGGGRNDGCCWWCNQNIIKTPQNCLFSKQKEVKSNSKITEHQLSAIKNCICHKQLKHETNIIKQMKIL